MSRLSCALALVASTALAAPAIAQENTAAPAPTVSEASFLQDHFAKVHCLDYYYNNFRGQMSFSEAIETCDGVLDIDADNYSANMDAFLVKYGRQTAIEIADKYASDIDFSNSYQPPAYPDPQLIR